jgi:hypothetical protein
MDIGKINAEELAKRVMAKLDERMAISKLARQIKGQLALTGTLFTSGGQIDPRDWTRPKDCTGDAKYICPAGGASTHNCEAAQFKCDAKDIYACGKFDCKNEYLCNPDVYDHFCVDEFDCKKHTCAGKHIFLCSDEYTCSEVFKCKHCNPEPCNGNYIRVDKEKPPGKCSETYYDTTSGDFVCGKPDPPGAEDPDEFSCPKNFECAVKDQFECADSTTFKCGNSAPDDTFTCNTQNKKFECEGTFSCSQTIAPYNP